ncbi:hypothetical protein M3647_23925 [Paenibacillus cellulositrophicus]|uniref:hypothetical protein n=1 Tax=Paenibacillus cellulositrophicus TaxID=562959 RepID=UPI00204033EA|nr:hypothetical protein [Paenibacillus cellulositrophicus]MCM3000530.1 hypothetical protein [Paenibacillus cellulositrophicus]
MKFNRIARWLLPAVVCLLLPTSAHFVHGDSPGQLGDLTPSEVLNGYMQAQMSNDYEKIADLSEDSRFKNRADYLKFLKINQTLLDYRIVSVDQSNPDHVIFHVLTKYEGVGGNGELPELQIIVHKSNGVYKVLIQPGTVINMDPSQPNYKTVEYNQKITIGE